MKKLIGFLFIVLAFQLQAVNLETPGTFLGPMEIGRLLKTWETNLQNEATTQDAAIGVATAKIASGFTTNFVYMSSLLTTGRVWVSSGTITNVVATGQ